MVPVRPTSRVPFVFVIARQMFLVVGHGCVDVNLGLQGDSPQTILRSFVPGTLSRCGPASIHFGGCVPNTGMAMMIYGASVEVVCLVGNDEFGRLLRQVITAVFQNSVSPETQGPCKISLGAEPSSIEANPEPHPPASGLSFSGSFAQPGSFCSPSQATSYSLILSPEGMDRIIFHCPGVNALFQSHHVSDAQLHRARNLHVGYPPLLESLCLTDGGSGLVDLLTRSKKLGLTTSLDMCSPNAVTLSTVAAPDWKSFFRRVGPLVDIFTPSIEEITDCGLIDTPTKDNLLSLHHLRAMSSYLLDECGMKIVLLKLGRSGLYLRTGDLSSRGSDVGAGFCCGLEPSAPAMVEKLKVWSNVEKYTPAFSVRCAGTTGAGDSTIAMFLYALCSDKDGTPAVEPDRALELAAAAGAFNVERHDSTSGLRAFEEISERIAKNWTKHEPSLLLPTA
jgi:sugar/nucleoside kinase (ribokinase family)